MDHVETPGHDGQWVSVMDLPRQRLATHPWSLSGGGASEVTAILDQTTRRLQDLGIDVGMTDLTGEDEAYVFAKSSRHPKSAWLTDIVLGDEVRDYEIVSSHGVLLPRNLDGTPRNISTDLVQHFWSLRTSLKARQYFGQTPEERGYRWFDHAMFFNNRHSTSMSISFAEVATHNHFVLDRGGKVFKQTAPVIKLPAHASENEHVALLGVLNSSTACFWLKQNCHCKGNGGINGGIASEEWEKFYQLNGSNVANLPLPTELPFIKGRALDNLAAELIKTAPATTLASNPSPAAALIDAEKKDHGLRRRMVAAQEELDWETYRLYGLIEDDLTYADALLPEVALGQRAFEIMLARGIGNDASASTWFTRHGATPVTEVPADWPADYRELVQRRLDAIETNPHIRLLEKPEFKRRWATEPWGKRQERALRTWLLDRLENRSYWFDAHDRPAARSISRLADMVSRETDLINVLALWEGTVDIDVTKALTKLLSDEAVPYLAAVRLQDSGLRKREAWEETWKLQRREDAGEDVGKIPVPPKYATADFRKASWWQARGKLDVPKERLILYPDAGRSTDPTLLLGWAGWDHVQQFLVLASIMDERIAEGADDAQLIPLVAGMAEVLPWVKQWHADLDPTFGMSMADFCSAQLEERMTQLNVSTTDLKAWRPATATRGRRAVKENA